MPGTNQKEAREVRHFLQGILRLSKQVYENQGYEDEFISSHISFNKEISCQKAYQGTIDNGAIRNFFRAGV